MVNSTPRVLIGKDCRISGSLSLVGEALIDGAVKGEVVSTGDLTVGESGVLDAQVRGRVVHVYGRVVGNVECSEKLELHAGAKVYGNLRCKTIVIEDGVAFEGQCFMDEEGTDSTERSPVAAQNSSADETNGEE